jgi:hypothetical protein
MSKEECKDCKNWKGWRKMHYHGAGAGGGAVYGLGLIGAIVYYFQHASTGMDYVYGFLKAIVWPAFLIHKIFSLLGM